jgi:hypothetical protein
VKLGKKPPVYDDRTLRFGAYVKPTLPQVPGALSYVHHIKSWPMYGNDTLGDCTCAAAGHMIQCWTANNGASMELPTSDIIAMYRVFNPGTEDDGCDMLSVLKWWRANRLDQTFDDTSIHAFAAIELGNQEQAEQACYLFGGIYLGLALPDFAVAGDMTAPWAVPSGSDVPPPNQNNGHCVPVVAYNSVGLTVVTWGELRVMSWGFYNAYVDEAYAVLSPAWFNPKGDAPVGFDLEHLERDLAAF